MTDVIFLEGLGGEGNWQWTAGSRVGNLATLEVHQHATFQLIMWWMAGEATVRIRGTRLTWWALFMSHYVTYRCLYFIIVHPGLLSFKSSTRCEHWYRNGPPPTSCSSVRLLALPPPNVSRILIVHPRLLSFKFSTHCEYWYRNGPLSTSCSSMLLVLPPPTLSPKSTTWVNFPPLNLELLCVAHTLPSPWLIYI